MAKSPSFKMFLLEFLLPSIFALTYAVTIPLNSTSRMTSSSPATLSTAPAVPLISYPARFTFTTLDQTLYPCSFVTAGVFSIVDIYCNGQDVALPEGQVLPPYVVSTAGGLSVFQDPEGTGSPTFGVLSANPGSVIIPTTATHTSQPPETTASISSTPSSVSLATQTSHLTEPTTSTSSASSLASPTTQSPQVIEPTPSTSLTNPPASESLPPLIRTCAGKACYITLEGSPPYALSKGGNGISAGFAGSDTSITFIAPPATAGSDTSEPPPSSTSHPQNSLPVDSSISTSTTLLSSNDFPTPFPSQPTNNISPSPIPENSPTRPTKNNPTDLASDNQAQNSLAHNLGSSSLSSTPIIPTNPATTSPNSWNSATAQKTAPLSSLLPDSTGYYLGIGTQTLVPGSQITVSGSKYSLEAGASAIIAAGSTETQTMAIPSLSSTTTSQEFVVASQTLFPGSAITVSGSGYSLQAGGSSVIVAGSSGTQIIAVSSLFPTSASEEFLVGSQTLVAGAAPITVSGTMVSLARGNSVVFGGSTTEPLGTFLGAQTTLVASGLGSVIEVIGGFATSTPTAISGSTGGMNFNGTVFTGGTSRLGRAEVSLTMGLMCWLLHLT